MKYAATGYEGDHEVDYVDIGWEGPAGQMFSSVEDLSPLLMQYFAAYPSLYQRKIDKDYGFVLSPQTLREMMRPVFINPDQTTGFGSPWEIFVRDGHMVRTKGGNIDGFSSEIAMIPELKLGIVALFNFPGRELMLTESALDILIPAFEEWTSEKKATEFRAPDSANYSNILGKYGLGGELLVQIHIDDISGFPILSCPEFALYGLLTPMKTKIDATKENESSLFIYSDLGSDVEYCFTITLDAFDGVPFTFVRERKGKYQAIRVDAMFYGVELVRMDEGTQLRKSLQTDRSSTRWLRGSLLRSISAFGMSFERDVVIE